MSSTTPGSKDLPYIRNIFEELNIILNKNIIFDISLHLGTCNQLHVSFLIDSYSGKILNYAFNVFLKETHFHIVVIVKLM